MSSEQYTKSNDIKIRCRSGKKLREGFEKQLREILKQGKIGLIAEEAGDDSEVWEHLKREDQFVEGFEDLFGLGSQTVDSPVATIAKRIADENPDKIRRVDIRSPNATDLTIEQRNEVMSTKILENMGRKQS